MSITAENWHCICVRNIQLKILYLFHCQLKGFNLILNCYIFFTFPGFSFSKIFQQYNHGYEKEAKNGCNEKDKY